MENNIYRLNVKTLTAVMNLQRKMREGIKDMRLEHLEKILFALHMFNYDRKTTPFYSMAHNELLDPGRAAEIERVGGEPEIMREGIKDMRLEHLEKILFALHMFNYDRKTTPFYSMAHNELLDPGRAAEIERIQWPQIKERSCKSFNEGKFYGSLKKSDFDKIITEVAHIIKKIAKSETAVHIDSIMLHIAKTHVLSIGSKSVITRDESHKITGILANDVRQLECIGYISFVIPQYEWNNMFEEGILAELQKLKVYPEEILKHILDPDFVNKTNNSNVYKLDHNYLDIDFCIEFEHPEYNGPRLRKDLVNHLMKFYGSLKKRSVKKSDSDKTITEVAHIIKKIAKSETAVHVDSIMLHIAKTQVIVRLDPETKEFSSPSEKLFNIPAGTVKYAPDDDKKWYVLSIGSKNVITRDESHKITGTLANDIRQLECIGYTPVVIPQYEWNNMFEEGVKQKFDFDDVRGSDVSCIDQLDLHVFYMKNGIVRFRRLQVWTKFEHPEYNGPRLRKDLVNHLMKFYGSLKKRSVKKSDSDKTITEVAHIIKKIAKSETAVHVDSIMPHIAKTHVIVRFDPETKEFLSPSEKLSNIPAGMIKYAPDDDKKWYALSIGSKNLITRDESHKITGILANEIRQLECIGYTPIMIPQYEWNNMFEEGLSNIPAGMIKYAPDDDKKWYALSIGSKNLITRDESHKITGILANEIRQLECIGYTPIMIPQYEWNNMFEEGVKQKYLKNLLFR
ncbi:hypothetical protein TSAR_016739 [Trichomalopsis sarcophagae]|uniref:RAP domain-containing protein n=1 Tax=Trichomalopsis sarcophagae TaxID=543379 RepID=A0A232FDC5_9HYME|nr:hypothetical protein TSAR_016739 [Trichomalopsis sarcophagae]